MKKLGWREGCRKLSTRSFPRGLRPVALCVAFSLAGTKISAAQEIARFKLLDLPVITPAQAFVNEYPGKRFPIGSSITLTRRTTAAARKLRQSDFQIRLFRLPREGSEPKPWEFFDPCYVYISRVLRIKGQADQEIHLGRFVDEAWLEPVRGGSMLRGRYLLVFEQFGDDQSVFRLHKDKKDAYFGSGLYIELIPLDRPYSRREIDEAAQKIDNLQAGLLSEIGLNSPARTCYRYKKIAVAVTRGQKPLELIALVPCETEILEGMGFSASAASQ